MAQYDGQDTFGMFTDLEVVQLFTEILNIPSPSGMEEKLANYIFDKCKDWGFSPTKDEAGNVYVRITGEHTNQETYCFASHMDEIGLMVTAINPDGSLNVERVGGTIPWKFGERPVEIFGEEKTIRGVTTMGSGHGVSQNQQLEWKHVLILTGLSPAKLSEYGIKPGTLITPIREDRGPIIFGDPDDPMIAAWTFDDKMGVVALLRLLKTIKIENIVPKMNIIIAFTVTEEIGCFGAKYLAQTLHPTYFIAVDGSPMSAETPMTLDNRPGIRVRDRSFYYSAKLIKSLSKAARNAGTELQYVQLLIKT